MEIILLRIRNYLFILQQHDGTILLEAFNSAQIQ